MPGDTFSCIVTVMGALWNGEATPMAVRRHTSLPNVLLTIRGVKKADRLTMKSMVIWSKNSEEPNREIVCALRTG